MLFRVRPAKQIVEAPARVQPAPAPAFWGDARLDAMPLPEVTEIDAAEGWALWHAAVQGKSPAEADTVLMGLLPA